MSPIAAAAVVVIASQGALRADEGGVSFWLPGQFGSLAAVPAQPGWAFADIFYFTDFRGSTPDPIGGVYHVAPDFRTITPILRHLAIANGVCLSPDGKVLWATELSAGD